MTRKLRPILAALVASLLVAPAARAQNTTVRATTVVAQQLSLEAVATPDAPTVTPQGTTGATTYSYRVSAVNVLGETLASTAGTTATGNAALDSSNFNRVEWAGVPGAAAYRVYGRSSGAEELMATVSAAGAFRFDDDGSVTPSGAVPTANATGGAFLVPLDGLVLSGTDACVVVKDPTSGDTVFWLMNQSDQGGDDDDSFQIGRGTTCGTNPLLVLNRDAELSLGTTTHTETLTIYGPGSPQNFVGIYNTANSNRLVHSWVQDNNHGRFSVYDSSGAVAIDLNARPTVNSFINVGNFGIATTSPQDTVDVLGDILQTSRFVSATNFNRGAARGSDETLTAVSGASVTSTGRCPDGAVVYGVTTRIMTALGTTNGTTGYTVGDGVDADRYGVASTVTAGTDTDNADATADWRDALTAAQDIVITATGGNFDGTGDIYVACHYLTAEAD